MRVRMTIRTVADVESLENPLSRASEITFNLKAIND